jgi:hypothetical protein
LVGRLVGARDEGVHGRFIQRVLHIDELPIGAIHGYFLVKISSRLWRCALRPYAFADDRPGRPCGRRFTARLHMCSVIMLSYTVMNGGRYTWGMIDLFSVPAGTIPQEDSEYAECGHLFPPEVFEKHQGKWVAMKGFELVAVRDTEDELRAEFGGQRLGLRFFDVPKDSDILIL